MPTLQEYQDRLGRLGALHADFVRRRAAELIQNPQIAEALVRQVEEYERSLAQSAAQAAPPADGGLADLIGLGATAPLNLGSTAIPTEVEAYDDTVTSQRVEGVGDLYYIYLHEKVGIFVATQKLQQLFKAGTVRLSDGEGATRLYRYDRKQVLRYTQRDRLQAYKRVFGYTTTPPAPGAKPNREFHSLFVHFVTQVAQFFRDKRVSDVIRQRTTDPNFGSIAIVRRAGLDLRNNLKSASYGYVTILRHEVLQHLDEAFRILGAADVKNLFGASDAWDVVEEVMKRYLRRPQINASQHSRMAVTGRNILQWLARPEVPNAGRTELEALLYRIADDAEEWLTSAETLGIARLRPRAAIPPTKRRTPAPAREFDWEYDY